MKKVLLLTILTLLLKTIFAQTQKHGWIVGGTGLFSSKTSSTIVSETGVSSVSLRNTQIIVSPDVGYFFFDKFVAGIKLSYSINTLKSPNTSYDNLGNSTGYGAGPFIRYYFLPKNKKFNMLVDGSYQFGIAKRIETTYVNYQPVYSELMKYNGHGLLIAAGPVINFNSTISFELLIAYTTSKYANLRGNNNRLMTGVGLQLYL